MRCLLYSRRAGAEGARIHEEPRGRMQLFGPKRVHGHHITTVWYVYGIKLDEKP